VETQVGEERGLIDVNGDLLGAALGSDVLCARQRRASAVAGEGDEILGDEWYGAPRALLPRRVGRRVNDNLTDDPPARVMGVTAGDEKPRQRLGDPGRARLGAMAVEMPECGADVTAVLHRPGELAGGAPRLCVIVDPSTVLAGVNAPAGSITPRTAGANDSGQAVPRTAQARARSVKGRPGAPSRSKQAAFRSSRWGSSSDPQYMPAGPIPVRNGSQ
jgi:hypothetical protein